MPPVIGEDSRQVGTIFSLPTYKTNYMIQPKTKIGSNIQQNFNSSAEINTWSKKYNIPIDEIQKIFANSGNSISKTLEILRQKEQAA